MSLTPTQLEELQSITVQLQEEFPSNKDFLWNATIITRLGVLGALYSTTGRLTTARISTARMAFNQRVDARGKPINAALKYIIYHPGLVDTVAQIRCSPRPSRCNRRQERRETVLACPRQRDAQFDDSSRSSDSQNG